jgi:hypothetical protein
MVEDLYDFSSPEVKKAVEVRMAAGDKGSDDMMDVFRIIGDMGNANKGYMPASKPASNNISGYSSNNNMFKS